ncbi:hypothetical protein DNTS_001523 [Danionella cerebrum]|uniref:Axonemal dynein light chain domain-containing protein 1 n=1 Tax=Danionella cerebrum TaxID=2873325 RepID=A0A553PYW4_9TELE|nr:hypothetical protein DNTS_001523 [Danionella translucida]TRY82879.1 hypothetical protein DNTS_001523 [Danionella translucida]
MSVKCSPVLPGGAKQASRWTRRSTASGHLVELPQSREWTDHVKDQNDFIPDELLATLASTACPQDPLAPIRLTKTPKDLKVCLIHRPDGVWHHPSRRMKYQYFLNHPTSLTGAGRKTVCLSFLMPNKETNSLETLIPEEYHIIQNKGVKGLQCYDDKFTVLLEDDKKKLRVFPSMKPSGRLEAMQLMNVMDKMLDKAGIDQEKEELTEHSQIENLMELIQTEQNIYNIIFHEVIRQVSVECAERGQLLAKLRQRYVSLLDRIPRQMKGLHTQTLAQMALDRRLTEEILHFKNSIAKLNIELTAMKEHDESVSKEAEESKEELAKALDESQRNANIVAQYHDLYELQRKRLEERMSHVSAERDLWRNASYSLAVKTIKINKLYLVKRINISEQTWAKTSDRFLVFLTTKDSEDVSHIMDLTTRWKNNLDDLMENLRKAENKQRETIKSIHANILNWQRFYDDKSGQPSKNIDRSSEEDLAQDLKIWSKELTEQCERYGGEGLVSTLETLEMLSNLQESWIELCLQLFRRHPCPNGGSPTGQEDMRDVSKTITEFLKQLGIRASGESGVHATLIVVIETMESWSRNLRKIPDEEDRLKLENDLKRLRKLSEEAVLLLDSTQSESERAKKKPHYKIEIDDVEKTLKEFLFSLEKFCDCENMRLRDEVTSLHTKLIRWMVDLLLLIVPANSVDQESYLTEPQLNFIVDVSVEKLEEDAGKLSGKLEYFSKYITSSCQAIVQEAIQKNSSQNDPENELYQLAKIQKECEEWTDVSRLLLLHAKGSSVELQLLSQQAENPTGELEERFEVQFSYQRSDDFTNTSSFQATDNAAKPPSKDPGKSSRHVREDSVIKMIGHDGNITEKNLGKDTAQLTDDEPVMAPLTENAQDAFTALKTVRTLQQELLEVETQVVSAEVRALKAEEDLQAALDKIQDLERQLQALHMSNKEVTSKPSASVATSEGKTRKKKSEARPKSSKGSKKH